MKPLGATDPLSKMDDEAILGALIIAVFYTLIVGQVKK